MGDQLGRRAKLISVRKTNGRRTREKAAQRDYRALGRGRAVVKTSTPARSSAFVAGAVAVAAAQPNRTLNSARFDCWRQQEAHNDETSREAGYALDVRRQQISGGQRAKRDDWRHAAVRRSMHVSSTCGAIGWNR